MKITLAAIIGNEEAVIERFIRSFAPAVDNVVLVFNRGTKDQSAYIADHVCKNIGISLTAAEYSNKREFPHIDNYAAKRNMAWEIAAESSDNFLLWADADDILAPGAAEAIRAASEMGEHDVYIMPYDVKGNGKQIVHRERMVKASVGSRWKHSVHEQLDFQSDVTYKIIPATFIHAPLAEKTGSHERNLNILLAELEDAPRNLFYLAQEYFNHSQDANFKTAATMALASRGLGDLERYELLLEMAQTPGQDSRKLAAEAFAIMPDRREALALLTNYCIMDGDYPKAMSLAQRMMDTPRPKKTYWSQNEEWYGWKAEELHKQCLRLVDGSLIHSEILPTFSIIHATLGRAEAALQVREMWLSRARNPEQVEYIFGLHESDARSITALKGFKHTICPSVPDGDGFRVATCNHNYDIAGGIATGQIIICAQDDCYPPDGWDETLMRLIPDPTKPVFVFAHDGHNKDTLFFGGATTRAYVDFCKARNGSGNGIYPLEYEGMFSDNEVLFRAIEDGKAGDCDVVDATDELTLYHNHPFFVPNIEWDETYANENRPEWYEIGAKLFAERNPTAKHGCFARKVDEQ